MKSKSTAGLLSFFLGGVGVHRFYLGQTGLGFLYLVFCWTFIPAIIALVDAIIFWTMPEERFNDKYNGGRSYAGANSAVSSADEISKLNQLREQGILTQAEFEQRKRQLLR